MLAASNSVKTSRGNYPFGSVMYGRSFSTPGYRYGFNGKEKDDEIQGIGDDYDYGLRIYGPRLGRFLTLDPLHAKYPHYSPYQFAGNKPVLATDIDGAEENKTNEGPTPPSNSSASNSKPSSAAPSTSPATSDNSNKQTTQTALRNVQINVSGTPETNPDGSTKEALIHPVPNAPVDPTTGKPKLYKLPLYKVTVTGTLEDGTTVAYDFTAVRFGVQGDKQGNVKVVGKSSEGDFTPTQYLPNYPESAPKQYQGAIQIEGNYLFHVGQSLPMKNSQGNLGCVAISEFKYFYPTIVKLSGAKDIKDVLNNKLLQVHIEKADFPPLIPYKKPQGP